MHPRALCARAASAAAARQPSCPSACPCLNGRGAMVLRCLLSGGWPGLTTAAPASALGHKLLCAALYQPACAIFSCGAPLPLSRWWPGRVFETASVITSVPQLQFSTLHFCNPTSCGVMLPLRRHRISTVRRGPAYRPAAAAASSSRERDSPCRHLWGIAVCSQFCSVCCRRRSSGLKAEGAAAGIVGACCRACLLLLQDCPVACGAFQIRGAGAPS